MNKILLITQHEFLSRIQKKSFLVTTILIPLIMPTIMAVMIYLAIDVKRNPEVKTISYIDKSELFKPKKINRFTFKKFEGTLEAGKRSVTNGENFGFLYIPSFKLLNPKGITLYTEINPGLGSMNALEEGIASQIREEKIKTYNIKKSLLKKLHTSLSIRSVVLGEKGEESASHAQGLAIIGTVAGILIYMFVLIYGSMVMYSVVEEKTARVMEIIVSSVRPFQLMTGKILGAAAVSIFQFSIWALLLFGAFFCVFAYFGIDMFTHGDTLQNINNIPNNQMLDASSLMEIVNTYQKISLPSILAWFLFFFMSGYLMYGALFAAIGASVNSITESQSFTTPITLPLLASYFALFAFITDDPHGTVSIWFSMIPFTSPIAMMGRIPYGVPTWQLIASMLSLIGGFAFTMWIAARIYRIGILMHGAKPTYKTIAKWVFMKG